MDNEITRYISSDEVITLITEKAEYVKELSNKLNNSFSFGLIERNFIEDFMPRNRKERRHGRLD